MASVSARDLARLVGDFSAGGTPLYAGLSGAIAAAVEAGHLPPGVRLPAERRLAAELGVSRNTVVAAYDQLRARRLVRSRQGSGTVVNGPGVPLPGRREARVARTLLPGGIFEGVIASRSDVVDLRAGYWVGTDELPAAAFDLGGLEIDRWVAGHGYYPAGIPPLRAAVADRLSAQGLPTRAEEVVVTSGAQQALALLVGYAVDPGDHALVEDPTYPGVLETLLAAGAVVDGVPRSLLGLDMATLHALTTRTVPRLTYLIPTVHNPLGTTLDERERLEVLAALRSVPLVVEDLSLADTLLEGGQPPPLAAYAGDRGPTVVSVGSLSKAMWGGLRIGWLRAPAPLVQRLTHLKAIHDIGTPVPSQVIAVRLLEDAEAITRRRRANAAGRLRALQGLLAEHLPGWSCSTPRGGLSLWIRTGAGADFPAFAGRHGVAIASGSLASPSGRYTDHLRLPFGQPLDVLASGVHRLASAWHHYTRPDDQHEEVSAVL